MKNFLIIFLITIVLAFILVAGGLWASKTVGAVESEMTWDEYQDYLSMLTFEGSATHKKIKENPDKAGVIRGQQLNKSEYKSRRDYLMDKAEKAERKLR